jgi:hypothetical protein
MLVLIYIVGGISLLGYALVKLSDAAFIVLALVWFASFVVLQFKLIRCSRCDWPLLLVRRGRTTIPIGWIPERCSKCGALTAKERAR